jgi:thiazole/oxazole-forming peptide maturase SagD family component
MTSFLDPRAAFLEKMLAYVARNPYFKISYSMDRDLYFRKKTSVYFGERIYMERNRDRSLGALHLTTYAVDKDGGKIASFGASLSSSEALVSAQAEFLERASSFAPLDRIKKDSFSRKGIDRDASHIVASELGLRWSSKKNKELYWGLADLAGGKRHVTSSGIAGHFDRKTATLNAWLELIERDAFLVHWMNTISPRKIAVDRESVSDTDLSLLLGLCQKEGVECAFLDMTTDLGVPVCAVIVSSKIAHGKRTGIGAKAGFDREVLVRKALVEALTILNTSHHTDPASLPTDFAPFADARIDKRSRIPLSLGEEGRARMAFLMASAESVLLRDFCARTSGVPSGDVGKQLSYLRSVFRERYEEDRSYDVFSYAFRNELASTFDFHVVRVMCDALYPLHLSEQFADPDHPRLKEFVRCTGQEAKARLNTFPHPFS